MEISAAAFTVASRSSGRIVEKSVVAAFVRKPVTRLSKGLNRREGRWSESFSVANSINNASDDEEQYKSTDGGAGGDDDDTLSRRRLGRG